LLNIHTFRKEKKNNPVSNVSHGKIKYIPALECRDYFNADDCKDKIKAFSNNIFSSLSSPFVRIYSSFKVFHKKGQNLLINSIGVLKSTVVYLQYLKKLKKLQKYHQTNILYEEVKKINFFKLLLLCDTWAFF
jgi:hypothetical protein